MIEECVVPWVLSSEVTVMVRHAFAEWPLCLRPLIRCCCGTIVIVDAVFGQRPNQVANLTGWDLLNCRWRWL